MSVENVREYLKSFNAADRIIEFNESSATVKLAAALLGVEDARIAKSISFKTSDGGAILVVSAGDAKVDNRKFKETFGFKAKMLTPEEAIELIGHAVGGVCPFAVKDGVKVYLDRSLLKFETVYPAAGSASSAIELSCDELFEFSKAEEWVDVCKEPIES